MNVLRRHAFVLINSILLLLALALIILGIAIQTSFYACSTLLSGPVIILGALTLLLGLAIFCVSLFVFAGINWKERPLFFAYSCLLMTLICVEVSLVASICTLRPLVLNMIQDSLRSAESRIQSDVLATATWSSLQTRLKCCGVNNSTEWFQHLGTLSVPDSCCVNYSMDCGGTAFRSSNVYTTDCSSAIYQYTLDKQRIIVVSLPIFVLLKVLALFLARDYHRTFRAHNFAAELSGKDSKNG